MAENTYTLGRSSKTKRTPPKKVPPSSPSESIVADTSKQSCQLCKEFDNVDMVRCDDCKEWFHFVCVGVNRDIEKRDWSCNKCSTVKSKEKSVEENVDRKSTKSSRSSKTLTSHASSAARKKLLALERIEEEKVLREAREKEYLDKKYKTLEDLISSDEDSDPGNLVDLNLSENSKRYTAQWVENQTVRTNETGDEINQVEIPDGRKMPTGDQVPIAPMQTSNVVFGQSYDLVDLNEEVQVSVAVANNHPPVSIRQSTTAGAIRMNMEDVSKPSFGSQDVNLTARQPSTSHTDNRRETTYSVFTNQVPIINSSVTGESNTRSFNQVSTVGGQTHFAHSNIVQTSSIQTSNVGGQSADPKQQILISLNGGKPSSSIVLQRQSFQNPSHLGIQQHQPDANGLISDPNFTSGQPISNPTFIGSQSIPNPSFVSGQPISNPTFIGSQSIPNPSFVGGQPISNPTFIGSQSNSNPSFVSGQPISNPTFIGSQSIPNPSFVGGQPISNPTFIGSQSNSNPSFVGGQSISNPTFIGSQSIPNPSFVGGQPISNPTFIGSQSNSNPSFVGGQSISNPSFVGGQSISNPSFVGGQPISNPTFIGSQSNSNPSFVGGQSIPNPSFVGGQPIPNSTFVGGQSISNPNFTSGQPISNPSFIGQSNPNPGLIGGQSFPNSFSGSSHHVNPSLIPPQSIPNSFNASGQQGNPLFIPPHQPLVNSVGGQPMGSSIAPHQSSINSSSVGGNLGNYTLQHRPSSRLDANQLAARQAMPKNLPTFRGTPEEWPMFLCAYENSTKECGYSNGENLIRLMDCLKGDALEAVRSILLHPDSVPEAMQTLEMMFGRPELVIETLMEDIQKEPPPKDNDLNSLIRFAMKVRNLCATIRKFGPLDHLQNPLLVKSLVDKLPTQTRINWAYFKHASPNVNLATFADWLYSLATVTSQVVGRPKTDSFKKERKDDRKDSQRQQNPKSNHINAQIDSSSINRDSNTSLQSPKQCSICSLEACKQIQDCNKFRSFTLSERWETVKSKRLCNSCFGRHRNFKCRSRKKCQVDGCQSTHHVLLHDKTKQAQPPSTSHQNSKSSSAAKAPNKNSGATTGANLSTGASANNCNSLRTKRCPAIFRIIPVIVYGKKKIVQTFAYLDDGSDLTLVERELAAELELVGIPDVLNVQWAFKNSEERTDSEIVSLRISGDFKHAPQYKIKNASTVEKLFLPTQSMTKDWLASYPHLKGIPISTYENATPRILIGLHSSKLMVSQETIEGEWNEPIACGTRLGWVVQGPDEKDVSDINPDTRFSLNICGCHADNQLHQLVKEFFSFESFGTRTPEKILESKEITRARQILETTTVNKNGRYETGLLWRNDDIHLPDSYGMALKRLNCLEKKMTKDPVLAKKLCDQIEDFVRKDYIRKLLSHEIEPKSPRTWYLQIFVAFNPKKPLKFRTVWDAAATVKNVSLNSVLLKGPDQLVLLPDVLRRFRERSIATTGDITEMFHQVRVREEDQCAQRFLWRDGESDRNPDVYVMQVLTFGANCSPSSAQYVKNENALKFKDKFPRAVEAIVNNHYMDDMLECSHTVEGAVRLAKEVKFIHQKASFEIRNFTSNSTDVLRALGETIETHTKNLNLSTELTTERVLGMFWNTSTDMFTFSLKYAKIDDELMIGKRCPTKREVLRALMSIFDPLGLISNVLVYAKILLQKIWRKSTNWDEQITGSLQDDWITWVQLLPQVEKLEIPRLYSPKLSPNCPKSIQLHIFVDASLEACATAIYYRFEDEYGVDCCLVGAKTKVAPNKPLTVPRLELQGGVLGTRLASGVGNSHRLTISKRYFWTDSQTVLSWITSEARKYNQFVAFRVGEILESSVEDEWHWVSTEDNIADEATKWKNKPDISSSSKWLKGPSFLYQPEKQWNQVIDKKKYTTDVELRPRYLLAHFTCQTDNIIYPSNFSSWRKLLRTLAYVLRFVQNLKTEKKSRIIGPLTRSEYVRAENRLYQQAQKDCFMDEIVIIRHNSSSSIDKKKDFDKTSLLKTCSPYIDDSGVLRIKGRIDAAKDLTTQTKRPIILPRDHRITKLIIDSFHRKHHHSNHQTTLNEVNLRYFVPSLRRALKSVIQNMCQRCKNDRANPKVPEMADLPPARLATFTRPFTYAGIDYFGPFYVKVKRSKEKRWGVLVTCLTTRAIHIEVAHSLDTKSCIMAIGRFTKRRGSPAEYYSDNGSNFHSSEKELRTEFEKLDKDKMEEAFTNSISQSKFNPPLASHMGGSWERMIQTVKSILYKTMPTRTPTEEMFASYIVEAEYIVNCRPLTYVHLDHLEDEILTPNHFLVGSSGGIRSPGDFNEKHLLRDDWKAVQHMTNLFWRRFNVEYLPTLTRRTKWFKDVKEVEVGDLVIVVDDKNERNTWPKGIVKEVYRGKDKKVRSAGIRIVRGRDNLSTIKVEDIKHQLLVRPVAKLAVLDVAGVGDTLSSSREAVNGRENVIESNSAGQVDRESI